ncbi:hypothetical protein Btru_063467 [Bulinus truncatus]|nr:hypothetical protein Btru_063467 [Bulinus truncatus]
MGPTLIFVSPEQSAGCIPTPQAICSLSPQAICIPSPQAICIPSPQAFCIPSPQAFCIPSPQAFCIPFPQALCIPSRQAYDSIIYLTHLDTRHTISEIDIYIFYVRCSVTRKRILCKNRFDIHSDLN